VTILKQHIINTILNYVEVHGKKPIQEEFKIKNGYTFSKDTIIKQFGTYNNCLIECGLAPQKSGETQYEIPRLVNDLRRAVFKYRTTNRDVLRKGSGVYDRSVYERLFGSWSKAIEKCGVNDADIVLMKYFEDYIGQDKIEFLKDRLGSQGQFTDLQNEAIDAILWINSKYDMVTSKLISQHYSVFKVKKAFQYCSLAIIASGLIPTYKTSAKNTIADDGHMCDSIEESIIDNWLYGWGIEHSLHVNYPDSEYITDFVVSNNHYIEYAGFARGNNNLRLDYHKRLEDKKVIAQTNNIRLTIISDVSKKSKLELRAALGLKPIEESRELLETREGILTTT
jgi:hypothetical protein